MAGHKVLESVIKFQSKHAVISRLEGAFRHKVLEIGRKMGCTSSSVMSTSQTGVSNMKMISMWYCSPRFANVQAVSIKGLLF